MQTPVYRRWQIAQPIPPEIDACLEDYPKPIRQILYNRGCRDAASADIYLNGKVDFVDPFRMLGMDGAVERILTCLLYTSPSPRDRTRSRMPSSA